MSAAPSRNRDAAAGVLVIGVLVTGALTACDTPAEPTRAQAAALRLDVVVPAMWATDTVRQLFVSGWFTPGREAGADWRRVAAPLRVGAESVAFPTPLRDGGAQLAQRTLFVARTVVEHPLVVTPPAVEGVQPQVAAATLTAVRKLDGDTVRPDADGALRVRLASAPGDARATRRWSFAVSGATTLAYSGTGLAPTELTVPRELLPPPEGGGWRVSLEYAEDHGVAGSPPPGEPYEVSVTYRALLFWVARPR